MRSTAYLLVINFLIYTSYFFVEIIALIYLEGQNKFSWLNLEFIATQVFVTLLGGILAAFVIRASVLLTISFIFLFIGFVFLEICYIFEKSINTDIFFHIGVFTAAVSCGLFRFIFPILILNQGNSKNIKMKIIVWLILIYCSSFVVYVIFPSPYSENVNYFLSIPTIIYLIVMILLIFGKYYRVYGTKSDILNIMNIMRYLMKRRQRLINNDENENKDVLISISRAIIFLFLITPYGICAIQVQYAYSYQCNFLRWPNITYYASDKDYFWPVLIYSTSAIVFGLILLGLTKYKNNTFQKFYSNLKLKIIVGYILMICAIFISGGIETYLLKILCNNNLTDTWSKYIFTQNIRDQTFNAVDISVFILVPSIALISLSEIIMIPTCVETLYRLSKNSIKYLSIAFLFAAIENGGFPDLIYFLFDYNQLLNKGKNVTSINMCLKNEYRLDRFFYIIGGCALCSLVISITIMVKLPFRFTYEEYEDRIEQQME